jgi:hypothetical protein
MDTTHWTARAFLSSSMVLGIVSVIVSTSLQQEVGRLNNPLVIRLWLSRGKMELEKHSYEPLYRLLPLESSVSALKLSEIPGTLLRFAVLLFLAGFGLYLLFSWLNYVEVGGTDHRNIFLVFAIVLSLFCCNYAFWSVSRVLDAQKREKEEEKNEEEKKKEQEGTRASPPQQQSYYGPDPMPPAPVVAYSTNGINITIDHISKARSVASDEDGSHGAALHASPPYSVKEAHSQSGSSDHHDHHEHRELPPDLDWPPDADQEEIQRSDFATEPALHRYHTIDTPRSSSLRRHTTQVRDYSLHYRRRNPPASPPPESVDSAVEYWRERDRAGPPQRQSYYGPGHMLPPPVGYAPSSSSGGSYNHGHYPQMGAQPGHMVPYACGIPSPAPYSQPYPNMLIPVFLGYPPPHQKEKEERQAIDQEELDKRVEAMLLEEKEELVKRVEAMLLEKKEEFVKRVEAMLLKEKGERQARDDAREAQLKAEAAAAEAKAERAASDTEIAEEVASKAMAAARAEAEAGATTEAEKAAKEAEMKLKEKKELLERARKEAEEATAKAVEASQEVKETKKLIVPPVT